MLQLSDYIFSKAFLKVPPKWFNWIETWNNTDIEIKLFESNVNKG